MNHFGNNNNTYTLSTSAISLLSDDIEMNRMYMERERMNDEYIHSLLSFVHDVEARQNKTITYNNDQLYQPTHYTHYDHINHYQSMPTPRIPSSTPRSAIDQQRLPLHTSKIPHRRLNFIFSTFVHYFKRSHIPTVVYVSNNPCYPNLNEFSDNTTTATEPTKEENQHHHHHLEIAKQSMKTNRKQCMNIQSTKLYPSPCQSFYSNETVHISNTNCLHHTSNVGIVTSKGNGNGNNYSTLYDNMIHSTNVDTVLIENSRHRRCNYVIS
jgi:hypothetical protein